MQHHAGAAYSPPFRSPLVFSVQNEDYQTEEAVLAHIAGHELRILMIASSGENVLSLLCDPRVASVNAVDLNPAQVSLCHLRLAALEVLSRDEQLRLLCADPVSVPWEGADERRRLYDRVCTRLPDSVRAFWDGRVEQDIMFGVQHVGSNELLMHKLQDRLYAEGFAPLIQPLAPDDLPRWQGVYTALMTGEQLKATLGIRDDDTATKLAGISSLLGESHLRALTAPEPERNPYVTLPFLNRYATAAGEAGYPRCLQREGQEALRRLGIGRRLRLRTGNIVDVMVESTESDAYDLISISNIADWMTREQFAKVVERAKMHLRPGGVLLARTLTGLPMIVEVMGEHLRSDAGLNAALPAVERGPWFRTLAVGFK